MAPAQKLSVFRLSTTSTPQHTTAHHNQNVSQMGKSLALLLQWLIPTENGLKAMVLYRTVLV